MAEVRVGSSGWRHPPWRGVVHPAGLPQRREPEHVAQRLRTVELDGSFSSLQRPASYRQWAGQTPNGFLFSVKGGPGRRAAARHGRVSAPAAGR